MQKLIKHKLGWILLLILFLIVNVLAAFIHTRFDLTKEQRYTISKSTKNIIQQLEDKVEILVFLNGDLPTGFKKLASATDDFLQLLKENNSSKIQYKFISPNEEMNDSSKQYQDTLIGMGATPINLTIQIKQGQQNKLIFPYAWIKYKGKNKLIALYKGGNRFITPAEMNSAEAMLEYNFAKTLNALINPQKPLLAYATGNGEITDARTYDLLQTVKNDYSLFTLDINKQPFIPDTFKVLLLVKPKYKFTEDEKLKIDQYLLHGGKIICFIDNLYAEQDSLQIKPELIAYDRNLNITDLLFKYGARINTDLLLDLQCDFMPFAVGGTAENPQFEFLHWNYYPLFESKNNHPINKNLGLVAGRFVNSIDTVKANGISKTILLSSSANSRILSTPALISLNENRNTPEDVLFKQQNIPVAVLLEGKFTSLYKNRISQTTIDSLQLQGISFIDKSINDGKLIVVADGDMVLNDVSQKQGPLPMGMNLFTSGTQYEYQFANRDFLLNCLEYLTNKEAIIETRNKDIVLRLLNTQQVEEDKTMWQLFNIAFPIAITIICGVVYQQIRKKRNTA